MFKHKVCIKCGVKNHPKNEHCTKCGEVLDAIVKKSLRSIVVFTIAFLILGSGIAYGANTLLNRGNDEPIAETNSSIKPETPTGGRVLVSPESYPCPSGTRSPQGGRINWDGSTYCIPEETSNETDNSNSKITQKTLSSTAAQQPTTSATQTPASTVTQQQTAPATQTPAVTEPTPPSENINPPVVDDGACDSSKATQLAVLEVEYAKRKANEGQSHLDRIEAIKDKYSIRGLLNSGMCQAELNSEEARHQQILAEIDAWHASEIIKVNQSCN